MSEKDYKEKIIQMIESIEDTWILRHIMIFVNGMTKEG